MIEITEELLLSVGFEKGPNYHPEGITYTLNRNGKKYSTTSLYKYLWIDGNLVSHDFKYDHQLEKLLNDLQIPTIQHIKRTR